VSQLASPEPDRGRKVDTIRRLLAKKAAEVIRSDPDEAALAVEIGLVDDRWLEDPLNHPISTSKPTEIIEQFLERSVERRPSLLSSLGLSAVQLLTAHRGAGDGETKVLTIVFTDLEGFTAYTDAHGDAAALALIDEQHRAASPIVRRRRGRVVKQLGDGLLCSFNDPDGAVRASLEMLDTSPSPLRLRAGIHMGEVIVSRGDVVGQVVNVAARITELIKGGQVVVTAETADTAGDIPGVEFKKLRARRLKGISERVQLREAVVLRP
jgi:adenylate cyclase